ncbi:MAG: HAD-IA family hydrolase [candidate division FCPU426 bacterium]
MTIPAGAPHRKYRAIFFDAGNTLFAVHPSVGAWYADVAQRHGLECDPQALEDYFRAEWEQRAVRYLAPADEHEWWRGLVRAVMDRAGGIRRFDPFFEDLYDLFASERVWRLFPETREVLAACRGRGAVVGIVSNWDSRLERICAGLGLTPQVDFILASAVVGVAKPDPGIFRLALQRAGVAADEALHIGDSLQDDVMGARAAGLDALWLTREGGSDGPPEVRQAASLRSVLNLC